MTTHSSLLLMTFLLLAAAASFTAWQRSAASSTAGAAAPAVLWRAAAFELDDQRGERVSVESLRGHVWIADFIFTSCTRVCPLITARMRMLQRALPDPTLRFVSFSVDPANDTPEALRAYAERWAKDEQRWSLLRTEPAALRQVTDGMRVIAEPSGQVADPITHTSLFFLIDGEGRVRGMYDSAGERAFTMLLAHARHLLDGAHTREPEAQDGAALVAALGCEGCHADPALAPTLAGLFGRDVMLADGSSARADAAYLRESILTPSAKLVAGYRDAMPSYASYLSGEQVELIVQQLSALPAPAVSAQLGERDPVCGMRVPVTPETLHARHGDHDYYFCSERCRDQFAASHAKP